MNLTIVLFTAAGILYRYARFVVKRKEYFKRGFVMGSEYAATAGAKLARDPEYDYLGSLKAYYVPVIVNSENWSKP